MSRFLITRTQTYVIEADGFREAEAVAEELVDIGKDPDTESIEIDIIRGLSVAQ